MRCEHAIPHFKHMHGEMWIEIIDLIHARKHTMHVYTYKAHSMAAPRNVRMHDVCTGCARHVCARMCVSKAPHSRNKNEILARKILFLTIPSAASAPRRGQHDGCDMMVRAFELILICDHLCSHSIIAVRRNLSRKYVRRQRVNTFCLHSCHDGASMMIELLLLQPV